MGGRAAKGASRGICPSVGGAAKARSGLRGARLVPPFDPAPFIPLPSLCLQDCTLQHPGYANVVLGDPAPFLFYPISSTEVRAPAPYFSTATL